MGPNTMNRTFIDPMIERNVGKTVTVSSIAERVGSLIKKVYASAKVSATAFTKSLVGNLPEKYRDAFVRETPIRRLFQPSVIADSVLFFASECSAFFTGPGAQPEHWSYPGRLTAMAEHSPYRVFEKTPTCTN